MPSIVIARTSEYINRARNIAIYVDEVMVDKISNGETRKIQVEEGPHRVKATIDWCSSPELSLDLHGNESLELELSGYKYAGFISLSVIAIVVLNFLLSRRLGGDYLLILLIPPACILSYYLTLGRKKYLRLQKADI